MKLLHVETKNFLGFPDREVSFTHPTTGSPLPLILVGGGPASGKTSLLEAIIALKESIGSYHVLSDSSRYLRSGATSGYVRGTWLLTPDETGRAGLDQPTLTTTFTLGDAEARAPEPALESLFGDYSVDPKMAKFEYFHGDRRLVPRVGSAPPVNVGKLRLARSPDKYAGFEHVLSRLVVDDGLRAMAQVDENGILLKGDHLDSLAPYKDAVAALCPWLRLTGVQARNDAPAVWFERDTGARVELYSLSHSEQQAVLFALAYKRLGLDRSVLLIDEPELHIHSAHQMPFLESLAGLSGDNQIIAATASVSLLESMPRHQTLVLDQRRGQNQG